ncbi:MAG: BatA domain-containing protein [Fibrobacterota bacterium]
MGFLNAGLLGLLALAAIPVIIHLINRRRALKHRFAAFEFLMRSRTDSVRRLRLRSLLLLIVRTLIVVLLVLGAAMPVLFKSALRPAERGNSGWLVVLDNSASMQYREQGMTGYEAGLRFLEKQLERDHVRRVRLLPLAGKDVEFELEGYAGEFRKKASEVALSFEAGRFAPVLRRARLALGADPNWDRLVIVSDFAESDWQGSADSLFKGTGITVLLVNTLGPAGFLNTGITHVALLPDSLSQAGSVRARISLQNTGPADRVDCPVTLTLTGQPSINGFADLPAGRESVKEFLIEGTAVVQPGFVRLLPDSFEPDDIRYFVCAPPLPIRTLAVDGDPAAHYTESETFFIEKALAGFGAVISPASLTAARLEGCRVLLLCNMVPTEEQATFIRKFVEEGGGLFVTLGGRVVPEEFNVRLAPLFGRTLRDRKAGIGRTEAEPATLEVSDPPDPVVALLAGISDPEKYVYRDWYLLEPAPSSRSRTLLSLSSGEPLLIHAQTGKGSAFLYLSTVDMAWNDFPLRPYFLPFIREAVRFLANEKDASGRDTIFCGDTLPFPAGRGVVRIDDPSGRRHVLQGGAVVRFAGARLPGLYHVMADGLEEKWAAVNLSPRESASARVAAEKLDALFAGAPRVKVDARSEAAGELLQPRPLWPWCFLAALILALVESLLTLPFKGTRKQEKQHV